MFSQRHYERIAAILASMLANGIPRMEVNATAHYFANAFASDNKRFKRHLFLAAIGLKGTGE